MVLFASSDCKYCTGRAFELAKQVLFNAVVYQSYGELFFINGNETSAAGQGRVHIMKQARWVPCRIAWNYAQGFAKLF